MNKTVSDKYQESYIEETLPNGLKVILWHKEGYQKSYFVMATPFGALDVEQIDEKGTVLSYPAGVAHFLEHKMFEDENGEDVMTQFSGMGASVNATTSYDETTYYFTTTQDPLPPLKLLLDFTQKLNISEESIEKEKGIILQENQMYRQISDIRLFRECLISLFQNHPITEDISGNEKSIQAMSKVDLEKCYALNYHPSRMVLVGVTGQPVEPILEVIRADQASKTFADVPMMKRKFNEEPETVAREYFDCEMDIHIPKIAVAYKLKGIQDAAERLKTEWCIGMVLDVYFSSMNEDYQQWIRKEIISDYFGYETNLGEDFGYMMFYGECEQIEEFTKIMDETLNKAIHQGISTDQLEQLKHRYFGQNIRLLNDFEGIGITMFRDIFDQLDFFDTLDMVEKISMEDIKQALQTLNLSNKTVTTVRPRK